MSRTLGYLASVEAWEEQEGAPAPLGATWVAGIQSWNFAIYSQHATKVTLELYGANDPATEVLSIDLDPLVNKTGRIWHVMVPERSAPDATSFAWRIGGPDDPAAGQLFDRSKVLMDPFARRLLFPPEFSREAAATAGRPNDGKAVLGVLPHVQRPFDWRDAPKPRHTGDTIVYEVHVKGFTQRGNSQVAADRRGTFLGMIDKIPYLKALGVTVVELLPVHQYDPQEGNYWGYMTMNFFAPHHEYAVGHPVDEFRQMVRAMHAAGIEVWLDVVYNHTAEGGRGGPTYSLRGIDNVSYYLVEPNGDYNNDSGCGNTTHAAHPAMRALVLASLRYWAVEMGVDGFRFDLASILARDLKGDVEALPALIAEISALAEVLDVKVVAEAWDLGAYLLGRGFPGIMWRQWNGKFRDDVRSFVKGDDGLVPALITRVYGSDDLFPDGPGDMYRPYQSINFITAHDGFCLYDLVSYNDRHNEANGHGNTDGSSDNRSWNCGWEGDEGVPDDIKRLRFQQIKNFAALMMTSNGAPMIVAGDEFGNTQGGNNNPYNQDNETTWLDWDRLTANEELFTFWSRLIGFRKSHRSISRSRFWRDDVHWFGVGGPADLSPSSHSVGWSLKGERFSEPDLCVLVNAYYKPLTFDLGAAVVGVPGPWRRVVDTSLTGGQDFVDPSAAPVLAVPGYEVAPRSVVVLIGPDPAGG
jgi:isoamylase